MSLTSVHGVLGLLTHIAAAGLVTIHTLMRKRDVPASIGWIGMAWLAPALGALLYFAFGINRVRRRALRLMGGDPLPAYPGRQGAPEDPLADLETAIGAVTRRAPNGGPGDRPSLLRRSSLPGNAGGDRGRQIQRQARNVHFS